VRWGRLGDGARKTDREIFGGTRGEIATFFCWRFVFGSRISLGILRPRSNEVFFQEHLSAVDEEKRSRLRHHHLL